MNQGVHTVDLLLWLMGDVERVLRKRRQLCTRSKPRHSRRTLEFANGAIGTLEAATSV